MAAKPNEPSKHEKKGPDNDKQVPPKDRPSPREPKPGKHGK